MTGNRHRIDHHRNRGTRTAAQRAKNTEDQRERRKRRRKGVVDFPGRAPPDAIEALRARFRFFGMTEAEASSMIVTGFIEPLVKELPMEYAVEMNKLIELQMEGSVG